MTVKMKARQRLKLEKDSTVTAVTSQQLSNLPILPPADMAEVISRARIVSAV